MDTAKVVSEFRETGVVVVRGFLDPNEISELQLETKALYEEGLKHPVTFRHGNLAYEILPEEYFGKRYMIQAYWFAWASSYFDKFRSNQKFLTLLEPLLGHNIKQVTQQIHWKPPGASLTGYRFHQDLRFRQARDQYEDVVRDTVTVGIAIDRATTDNGCLRVVPNSHTMGYLGLSDNGEGQLMKGVTHDDELRSVGIDPSTIVDIELEPGDLVMWGLLTVHGSLANTSNSDRTFAISSYVRGETSNRGEWTFRNGKSVPLGDRPQICKNERLHENLEPHYDPTQWYL